MPYPIAYPAPAFEATLGYQLEMRQTASFPDLQAMAPFPGASRGVLPPAERIRV